MPDALLSTNAKGIHAIPRNMLRLKFNVARTVRKRPSNSKFSDLIKTYCSCDGAEKEGKVVLLCVSDSADARMMGRTTRRIVRRKKVDGIAPRLSDVSRYRGTNDARYTAATKAIGRTRCLSFGRNSSFVFVS